MNNLERLEMLEVYRKLPTHKMIWSMNKPQLQRELKDISNYVEKQLGIWQPQKRLAEREE